MKLEDVLKAQGFTDADIQGAATLLGDQRFRGAVEAHVSALETDNRAFREENGRWADWAEKTNKPQVDGLAREKLELTGKVGSLEARLKALDPTFNPTVPNPNPTPDPNAPPAIDTSKLLTRETFDQEVRKYAAAQGSAIALANDLAMEYRRLTGNDMLDYGTTDAEGRPMRGMSALLDESRRANKALPDYIAEKFDFAGKRAKAAEEQKKAAEEAIRKDERAKVVSEFGNPNTRPGFVSQNPFIPPPAKDGATKMPWEIPAVERRNNRIQRALETQARSTVN